MTVEAPIHISHVIVGLEVGGAELALKRLIEAHSESANFRHSVISLTDIGAIGLQLRAMGVEAFALELRNVLGIPVVLWRLARLLRVLRPDIVQTWMYHADLLGGLAARLVGIRNVSWGIRATQVNIGSSSATAVVRHLCALISHIVPKTIVCVARAARLSHIAIGYDAARMVVIPNGFDIARLAASPSQRRALRCFCQLNVTDVAVGFVGRFHPDKGQHNFVQAAGLLARENPTVRFVMVGRDLVVSNTALMQWIDSTGFSDRFVLLGERSDVAICLAAMDIFCLSSLTEAFPNAVGEAMAMGLPCVVTDVGDAAMLVADTGVVVTKGDPTALALGLAKLLAMPTEARQQLGRMAKARVLAEFSMARCTAQFEALYQDIMLTDRT